MYVCVGWVLWHINICRLFNAKSIFIQTIQFSMSTVSLLKIFLFQAIQFSQIVLIQTIQFSINTVSMSKTVLFWASQLGINTV